MRPPAIPWSSLKLSRDFVGLYIPLSAYIYIYIQQTTISFKTLHSNICGPNA